MKSAGNPPLQNLASLPLKNHTGPVPDCVQAMKSITANFSTIVLATVKVGGWRAQWVHNFVGLIVASFTRCELLRLHALQGGAACDCEIDFIRKLMPALGFRVCQDGYVDPDGRCIYYEWQMERQGEEPFDVLLYVHQDADNISSTGIMHTLIPMKRNATVPGLCRVAVVSSPVTALDGQRADEKLNAALVEGLRIAAEEEAPI